MKPSISLLFATVLAAPLAIGVALAQPASQPAPFTAAQATAGKAAYDRSCAGCHGAALEGAGPAVTLKGVAFMTKFGGLPVEKLHADVRRMPPGGGTSDLNISTAIVAYLLQQNGAVAGARE